MDINFLAKCEQVIKDSYEQGVTLDEAEKLAGMFLSAQLQVAGALREADLDSRMKKSGVKAVKAAVYMKAATATDKKPSDVMLQAVVDMDKLAQDQQNLFDEAEAIKDHLQNYFNIFREAHIHFRGIAKGRFE